MIHSRFPRLDGASPVFKQAFAVTRLTTCIVQRAATLSEVVEVANNKPGDRIRTDDIHVGHVTLYHGATPGGASPGVEPGLEYGRCQPRPGFRFYVNHPRIVLGPSADFARNYEKATPIHDGSSAQRPVALRERYLLAGSMTADMLPAQRAMRQSRPKACIWSRLNSARSSEVVSTITRPLSSTSFAN